MISILGDLFTKKQISVLNEAILNQKWRIMINYGAVRSGKTFIDNYLFLSELEHVAHIAKERHIATPQYIIAAASEKTIISNILVELYNTFGLNFKIDKHGSFKVKFNHLPAVRVVEAYTSSIAGLNGIRGITAFGAYVNEASLCSFPVFAEIVKRCSRRGARIICDTNPGNPTHWLKTNYIDKSFHVDTIISNHFILDDNKQFLDSKYIHDLKINTPSGAMWDRAILGEWRAGDGLIYTDFDEKKMVVDPSQIPDDLEYYAGVDWGYNHFGSITVVGEDQNGTIYFMEERTRRLKGLDYWTSVAQELDRKYNGLTFYCDTANPDNIDHFNEYGLDAQNADKSVLNGITYMAGKIKSGHFYVSSDEATNSNDISADDKKQDDFIKEVYNYTWQKGQDKPIKLGDDVMDSCRYAIYTHHQDQNTNQINLYQF